MAKNDANFTLNIFEGVEGMGGIGNLPIKEEGEFAPQSYSKTGADNGVKDGSVSVPGGTGERPSASPEGGEKGPSIPSGDGSGKGYEMGPSIPKGIELSTDEWKRNMAALQKSFNEGLEVMQMLQECRIVNKTTEELQAEYTESVIDDAIFESCVDGPYYEAVDKANKAEVKKLAKQIRNVLCTSKRNRNWRKSKTSAGEKFTGILKPFMFNIRNKDIEARAWQIVCYLFPEKRLALKHVLEDLTNEFKDVLGNYKFKIVRMKNFMKAENLSEHDEKRSAIKDGLYLYILMIDDGSNDIPASINVDVDEKDIQKIKNSVSPDSSMNEFVEYMEACNKACDEEGCDKTEGDDKKCPKCGKDPCECDKKKD